MLFDAVRLIGDGYKPRIVFTSSIAVFGLPFRRRSTTSFLYPSHELRHAKGDRRTSALGLQPARVLRRRGHPSSDHLRAAGRPNKAASGFFSNIIREPLAGQEAVLPVSEDVRHWHASPRSAVGFLIHAATMDTQKLGWRRNLTMPGLAATVGEQIASLRRVAGEGVVARIRREPDPTVIRIVEGWPRNFSAQRAEALGFQAERDFDEVIRIHIDDELGGRFAA
jgi:nucleoside-diphosphate-sugar epimerase